MIITPNFVVKCHNLVTLMEIPKQFQDDGWGRISLEAKGSEQFQNIICVQNWVYLPMLTGFSKEMLKKTT